MSSMKLKLPLVASLLAGTLLVSAASASFVQQGRDRQNIGDRKAIVRDLDLRDRPLKDVVEFLRGRAGINIVIDRGIDTRVTLKLKNVHWRTALNLAAEQAKCVVVQMGPNVLKIEKPPRVRFAFDNAPITKVIDAIARISGANIITAPEVQGNITLRLRDVPWKDALNQIAKTLGYTVVEEDRNILRVVSPSTLVNQLVLKSFQLRYIRPKGYFVPKIKSQYVAGKFPLPAANQQGTNFTLLQALNRMLSPSGSIEYIEGQNVLFIKDTKPVLDEIGRLIAEVDVEPKQVFVDVKFVTTKNTDVLDYGINIGDTGWQASVGLGQIPTRLPFNLGGGGFEDSLIANDSGRGPFTDSSLNASGTTTVPDTIFGALNFTGVQAVLTLLKQDKTSEIVQAPKLIVLDHQPGTIFVGDTVRYAQASAEQGQAGGLQLVVEEASGSPVQTGFQLLIVPHIIPGEDKVELEVIPEAESLSGSGGPPLAPVGFDVFTVGAGGNAGSGSIALPRVSSSTIHTKMLLISGQTAVIGGLTTDSNTKTVTQVPFLGDIPVLGWAFKSEKTTNEKQSLIVFITPEIVKTPEETEASIRRILSNRKKAMESEYRRIFGGSKSKGKGGN